MTKRINNHYGWLLCRSLNSFHNHKYSIKAPYILETRLELNDIYKNIWKDEDLVKDECIVLL